MNDWVAVFSLSWAVSCAQGGLEGGLDTLGSAEASTQPAEVVGVDLLKGVKVIERPGTNDPKENLPASAVPIPAAGRCIEDPEFGTRFYRVSDAVALGIAVGEPETVYWDVIEPLRIRWVDKGGRA